MTIDGNGMEYAVGEYSVELKKIADEFKLETIYVPEGWEKILIKSPDVSRPGLALGGFFDCFDHKRIQLVGNAESEYLGFATHEERKEKLDALFAKEIPALIVTTSLPVFDEMLHAAEKYSVPLFRTAQKSSEFQAALIASLNIYLAPRITRHGVLVEVYGEGILMLGESGVGKSETAIELVKRGHRFIADDAVEIKKVSAKTLVGSSPEIIRHFIELRGIGIVDVRRLFGMGAVKETEKIDMVIKLEQWDKNKIYDRLGLEQETTNILGIEVPTTTLPVRPGRNLAIILEIAAMNNRQKKMGYNTAEEFNKRMNRLLSGGGTEENNE